MSTVSLSAFEDALDRVNVGVTRTPVDGFGDAIRSVAAEPAVGAPLPFDGVSLPDWVRTNPRPSVLDGAATGVTAARLGIADYGSLVIESAPGGDEPASLFAETHVAVVRASDIVPDMPAAFERLGATIREGRGDHVIATGPSATADMGDLVLGAHGPKSVHAVLLEDG